MADKNYKFCTNLLSLQAQKCIRDSDWQGLEFVATLGRLLDCGDSFYAIVEPLVRIFAEMPRELLQQFLAEIEGAETLIEGLDHIPLRASAFDC